MAKKPSVKGKAKPATEEVNEQWARVRVLWRLAEKGKAIKLAMESEMPSEDWPEGMAAHKFAAHL